MSRWKRIFRSFWMRLLLLVLIFSAGSVTGYCIGSIWTESRFMEIMKQPRPKPDGLTQQLSKSLELTEAQSAEVQKVVRRHHAGLEKIRQEVAPRYVAEFDQLDQEMQGLLTDVQRVSWKKKAAGMREFWEKGWSVGRGRKRGDGDHRSKDQRSETRSEDKSTTNSAAKLEVKPDPAP